MILGVNSIVTVQVSSENDDNERIKIQRCEPTINQTTLHNNQEFRLSLTYELVGLLDLVVPG